MTPEFILIAVVLIVLMLTQIALVAAMLYALATLSVEMRALMQKLQRSADTLGDLSDDLDVGRRAVKGIANVVSSKIRSFLTPN